MPYKDDTNIKRYATSYVVNKQNADGSTTFRLTERKVDRDGDVVEPGGVRLDNFKKNPIVLFAHGFSRQQGSLPVGRMDGDKMKQNTRVIEGNVFFHDKGSDPFSAMIAEKVHGGFLNAGSMGFIGITINREPVLPKQTGVTFEESELLEFSIVPIPSLASATARREFERFAYKCAEFDQPLEDEFMEAIDKKFGLYNGVMKALEDASNATRTEPAGTMDAILEAINKQGQDIEQIKTIIPVLNSADEFVKAVNDHEPTGDVVKDLADALNIDEMTTVMVMAQAILTESEIHRAHV